jgi:RIO kinase 2
MNCEGGGESRTTTVCSHNLQDYRVLGAVEIGMKTHELVPVNLCMSIAKLRHGGANKVMSSLLRDKLLSHDRSKGYDGYRLTNSGYDILALRTLFQKKIVSALGDKIGIGKESDIYIAATPEGKQVRGREGGERRKMARSEATSC